MMTLPRFPGSDLQCDRVELSVVTGRVATY